jgi:hypothetical protein
VNCDIEGMFERSRHSGSTEENLISGSFDVTYIITEIMQCGMTGAPKCVRFPTKIMERSSSS